MLTREVLQQALEVLTFAKEGNTGCTFLLPEALDALKAALAQPEQEPIYQYQLAGGCWIDQTKESYDYNVKLGQAVVRVVYTSPLQRPPLVSIEMLLDWKSQVNEIAARTNKAERYKAGATLKQDIADVIFAHGTGDKT